MKNALLFLLVIFCTNLLAQNSIKGKITDTNGKPVKFAFVTLLQGDSTQKAIAAKVADTSGIYLINVPKKGNYIVRATAVSHKESRKQVQIKGDIANVNLVMEPATGNLKEVSVTSKTPLVERKIDRIVMNVANNPLTAGKSSMEAIGLAPGVFVRDGQISINGNTSTRVMVNGKLLKLSGQDLTNYLNSLRSEEIKSIEIMAHPPAEYDAEGSGGLINIVLKRHKRPGLNGSIYGNFSQGKYAGTSDGALINFKQGKIGLFANYSYENEKSFHNLDQVRTFSNNGIYTAANRAIIKDKSHHVHLGGTYDISDKQYLAIDYTGNFSNTNQNWDAFSEVKYPANAGNDSYTKGLFPNKYKGTYSDIGLNYHITTDKKGSSFSFLSDYTYNKNETRNAVSSSTYTGNNNLLSDTAYKNYTPSTAKIFTADAKYVQVLNNKSRLSFGAKLSSSQIHNVANFSYLQNGEWHQSLGQNFIYDYDETILAGYINYSGQIFNTDFQIGLRGENTDLTGTLYDTAGVNKNPDNYFGLFPTVFLRRKLNKDGAASLSFVYNRRLSRPSYNDLNPHVVFIDNYTTGRGNPFLNPEYNNSYELTYTFHHRYSISASYSYANDVINNAIRPESNNSDQMMQQPINSGKKKIWMLTALAPVKITPWWTSQNTLQLSNQQAISESFDLQKNIATVQTNQHITFTNSLSLSLSAYYISNLIFANAVLDPFFNANIALQKKFFKNRLTVKASADNILNEGNLKGKFYYNDFQLKFNQLQQTQKFTLGFTYNFNLGKAFKSHKVESSNKDEKSRL